MHHKLDRFAFAHPFYIGLIAGLLIGSAISATIALHIVEVNLANNRATTKAQLCDILNDNYESFNNCLVDA